MLHIDTDLNSQKELYLILQSTRSPSELSLLGVSPIKNEYAQEILIRRPTIDHSVISEKIYFNDQGLIHTFESEEGKFHVKYNIELKNGQYEMILVDLE